MKKVLAIAFVGGLFIASCSKKSENTLQDSNVMLQEPETTVVVDSTKAVVAPDQGTAAAATPAPAVVDSTTAK